MVGGDGLGVGGYGGVLTLQISAKMGKLRSLIYTCCIKCIKTVFAIFYDHISITKTPTQITRQKKI